MQTKLTPEERFMAKVEVTDNCWLWRGYINPTGYGYINSGRHAQPVSAHRFVYELKVGPIPDRMQLDHLCRNRACVNPAHLEVVTNRTNTQRATALKTSCKHGHEYTPANTYIDPDGARRCRECNRGQMRRRVRK